MASAFARTLHRPQIGLLLLRLVVGGLMIAYGIPKFLGGADKLRQVGGAMSQLGITFAPEFWGFMAAFTEVVGGLLIIVGFLFRPAAAFLLFTMLVAFLLLVGTGDLARYGYPLTMGTVCLFFLLSGPGRIALRPEDR